MSTELNRRVFLKSSATASALGVAVGAGLLTPHAVLAEWNTAAFAAKGMDASLAAVTGGSGTEESDAITVKAPDVAENGSVVPITISSDLTDVTRILLFAAENQTPMVASFELGSSAKAFVSVRIKMGKTGDVVAVLESGGKYYSARKQVKVTIGGCGG